jgi:parallel beta-helix repeat protein
MNRKIAVFVLALVLMVSLVVVIVEVPIPVGAGTIYVDDDYGSEDATHKMTIQAAVDNATPGDTVFVYAGIYYEDIDINKTINLIGEDRDTTIINASNIGILIENTNYVNISDFTIEDGGADGVRYQNSNESTINNTKIYNNGYGIRLVSSNNLSIDSNIVLSSFNVGIELSSSSYNWINNNTLSNKGHGIRLFSNSIENTVIKNQVISNMRGIYFIGSSHNNIIDNIIDSNTQYGIAISNSNLNIFENNSLSNNQVGIRLSMTNGTNLFINNSIISSISNDIEVGFDSNDTFLNTTFDKNKSYFYDTMSHIKVEWYLHINVKDFSGNPVPNANVRIDDNLNGTFNQSFYTDINGQVNFKAITEYIEQDNDGDTIGEKTSHTPHKIVAWNDTLVGYVQPVLNESKNVTIVLYNGTSMNLEPDWNLLSLPRIQSDTDLPTVLQSIEGQYDAVQWYNITDSNDPWKHHHISKPSNLNDLEVINYTIGLWVHITDPGGTTLVVFGDVLTSTQNITLYPGWNLVGYPSTTDKTRTLALNNLFFDTDVDAIWTHNATTQKWKEITASDNFEVGRGYWIHAKNKVTWIVPL